MMFYRSVGNLFGMSKGMAHYCINEVLRAITTHMKPIYIKWPKNEDVIRIANAIESSSGFPNVIGFIDGTHVPIKAPSADRDSFINRKGYASINVLAVCDNVMRFIYVYADRAGSVHDARVLRVSSLGHELENGTIFGGSKYHLLGDSAYPLLPNLMVPFRDNGHLTPAQVRFNAVHSSARCTVERAFGRLKGKFRRLCRLETTKLSYVVPIIESAFTLHNFILQHEADDADSDDDCDAYTSDTSSSPADPAAITVNAKLKAIAQSKRDAITSNL